jgi:hypothetical protein
MFDNYDLGVRIVTIGADDLLDLQDDVIPK